jgi:DNA-binding CsgD family transcriptional regulator
MFDVQTRVVMSNSAFASMIANSSVSACLGKTIHEILGDRAEELEAAIKQVWETSETEPGIQVLKGALSTDQVNHWLFTLFPIRDQGDGLTRVAAIGVETNHQKRVEQYLLTLMADMSWIRNQISTCPSTLQNRREIHQPIEKTGLLDLVSEEVSRFFAKLQGGAASSRNGTTSIDGQPPGVNHQDGPPRPENNQLGSLSPRELEILTLAGNGKSNKEIALMIHISIKTVETHRNRINRKLDLHSPTDVVLYAARHHLIS